MQLLQIDLHRILQTQKLELQKKLSIFKEIVSGCYYLYQQKIVHRDLKPENILRDKTGKFKIVDFGAAKKIRQLYSLLSTWTGTLLYMAPQILADQCYSSQCDIWSLGVILYEMLYGVVPFRGKNRTDILASIYAHKLDFPDKGVPEKWVELIRHMLQIQEYKRISWQELYSEVLEDTYWVYEAIKFDLYCQIRMRVKQTERKINKKEFQECKSILKKMYNPGLRFYINSLLQSDMDNMHIKEG